MCTINANTVRGCSYENFFTRKFIIRKFLYTKIFRSTVQLSHDCIPAMADENVQYVIIDLMALSYLHLREVHVILLYLYGTFCSSRVNVSATAIVVYAPD